MIWGIRLQDKRQLSVEKSQNDIRDQGRLQMCEAAEEVGIISEWVGNVFPEVKQGAGALRSLKKEEPVKEYHSLKTTGQHLGGRRNDVIQGCQFII